MPLAHVPQLLDHAVNRGYAVGAFVCMNPLRRVPGTTDEGVSFVLALEPAMQPATEAIRAEMRALGSSGQALAWRAPTTS